MKTDSLSSGRAHSGEVPPVEDRGVSASAERSALRTARGWFCYRVVLLLPVNMKSPLYCWLLGWAGWYANGGDAPIEEAR